MCVFDCVRVLLLKATNYYFTLSSSKDKKLYFLNKSPEKFELALLETKLDPRNRFQYVIGSTQRTPACLFMFLFTGTDWRTRLPGFSGWWMCFFDFFFPFKKRRDSLVCNFRQLVPL